MCLGWIISVVFPRILGDNMAVGETPGFFPQLWIMVLHILIIKKHKWGQSIVELILPCIICFGIPLLTLLVNLVNRNVDTTSDRFYPKMEWTNLPFNYPPRFFEYNPYEDPDGGSRINSVIDFKGFYVHAANSDAEVVANKTMDCFQDLLQAADPPAEVVLNFTGYDFMNSQNFTPVLTNISDFTNNITFIREYFNNTEDLADTVFGGENTGVVGLVINDDDVGNLRYQIRQMFWAAQGPPIWIPAESATPFTESACNPTPFFPKSGGEWFFYLNATFGDRTDQVARFEVMNALWFPISFEWFRCPTRRYIYNSFTLVQMCADKVLLERESGNVMNLPTVTSQQTPKVSLDESTSSSFLGVLYSMIPSFGLAMGVVFLTLNLVAEKEAQLKDGLRMVGLNMSAYWCSWVFVYIIIFSIISILCILVLMTPPPNSPFSGTDKIFLFLLFLTTGVWLIMLAFTITPFFSKSITAFAGVFGVTLIIIIMFATLNVPAYEALKYPLCILIGGYAFLMALDRIQLIESRGISFGWENVWQSPDGGITVGEVFIFLFISIFIMMLLAWYFDMILTGSYGTRESPIFCFKKSYWSKAERVRRQSKRSSVLSMDSVNTDIEEAPEHLVTGLQTFALTKIFSKDNPPALHKVNLSMYSGEITCLLGNNGAGKTTMIKILSGLIAPTHGTAAIFGFDIRDHDDMKVIRSSLGVCPQHNLIWDIMTCMENITLFGLLRGLSWSDANSKGKALLEELEMPEKANYLAGKLSGGQKRRLNVAMALIGEPRMVILDEPTSGVDAASRRKMWDVLKSRRSPERIILLTTHSMYEADILSDRKIIMANGVLRCSGTSVYLKNKFGVGYRVNIELNSPNGEENVAYIEEKIKGIEACEISDSNVNGNTTEIVLNIPQDKKPSLIEVLSRVKVDDKIEHVGVSMGSLDEVFFNIVSTAVRKNSLMDEEKEREMTEESMLKDVTQGLGGSWVAHLWLLFLTRLILAWNAKGQIIARLLPALVIIAFAGVYTESLNNRNASLDFNELRTSYVQEQSPFMVINSSGGSIDGFLSTLSDMSLNYILYEDTVDSTLDTFVKNPDEKRSIFLGAEIYDISTGNNSSPSWNIIYNSSAIHGLAVATNIMDTAYHKLYMQNEGTPTNKEVQVTYQSLPLPLTSDFNIVGYLFGSWYLALGLVWPLIFLGGDVVREKMLGIKAMLRLSGTGAITYWSSFYLYFMLYFLFTFTAIFITFLVTSPGFIETELQWLFAIVNALFNSAAQIITVFILSFIIQSTSGITVFSMIFFFFITFASAIVMIVLRIFDPPLQSVIATYLCFLYPPYSFFNYYLNLITIRNDQRTNGTYDPFGTGSENNTANDTYNFGSYISWTTRNLWEDTPITMSQGLYGNLAQIVLFYIVILCIDWKLVAKILSHILPKLEETPILGDEDVKAEAEAVQEEVEDVKHNKEHDGNDPKKSVLLVNRLRRKFGKKIAVAGVSYRVQAGEVFGLLGPNGAGKTTTLSMVIGELGTSGGDIYLGGINAIEKPTSARLHLGFCPQFDSLWDTVSVRWHVRIYASFRGVTKAEELTKIVQMAIQLGLGPHWKKKTKQLSGGTKRKLSFLLSIIGKDITVLLDEPSTGMDPVSMKYFWSVIKEYFHADDRKNKNIAAGALLTTHSMEEAEALCDRIAIMVKGKIRCIGSIQHVKHVYGSGYTLEVKRLKNVDEKKCFDAIQNYYPNAKFNPVDSVYDRIQFEIPPEDIKELSASFNFLEELKNGENALIQEYLLQQISLEQVFLRFAREQDANIELEAVA